MNNSSKKGSTDGSKKKDSNIKTSLSQLKNEEIN